MKKAQSTLITPTRIGSRISTSMAPRPSTANTAAAAASGLRSVCQRRAPASVRSSRARRSGSPSAAAMSASLRPAACAFGEMGFVVGHDVGLRLQRQAGEAGPAGGR